MLPSYTSHTHGIRRAGGTMSEERGKAAVTGLRAACAAEGRITVVVSGMDYWEGIFDSEQNDRSRPDWKESAKQGGGD